MSGANDELAKMLEDDMKGELQEEVSKSFTLYSLFHSYFFIMIPVNKPFLPITERGHSTTT